MQPPKHSDMGDGLVEMVGLMNTMHMVKVKGGIHSGTRLAQAANITIQSVLSLLLLFLFVVVNCLLLFLFFCCLLLLFLFLFILFLFLFIFVVFNWLLEVFKFIVGVKR